MVKVKNIIPDEAKRLRIIRKDNKLTQEELGEILGKGQPTIQKYESGTLYIPTEVYKTIHDKLFYNYEWLLSGTGTKKVIGKTKNDLITDVRNINDKYDMLLHNYTEINKKMNKIYRDFYNKPDVK